MEQLKGHVIREFNLSDDGYELEIVTDTHRFRYLTEGDCCAHAYLMSPDEGDVEAVIGSKVMDVVVSEVNSIEPTGDEYTDTEFYSIKTCFADLDLELRTEHNGYYGGWINFIGAEKL